MTRRRLLLGIALVLLATGPAASAAAPMRLSSTLVRPGGWVTVTGRATGCSGRTITLVSPALAGAVEGTYSGKPADVVRIGRFRHYSARFHLSRRLRPGGYAVFASCGTLTVASSILHVL